MSSLPFLVPDADLVKLAYIADLCSTRLFVMQQSNDPKHSTHDAYGACALQTCVDGTTASYTTGVNVRACFPVSDLDTLLLNAATIPVAVPVPCITKLVPHSMYNLERITCKITLSSGQQARQVAATAASALQEIYIASEAQQRHTSLN